jgi:protein involved in polysaccharide export with SLBB domain
MTQWKHSRLVVSLLSSLLLLGGASAQDLDELVSESEREEEELRSSQTQGTVSPEQQGSRARLQLPKDENLERLRISQDRQIDPESYVIGPSDVLQLYVWGEFDQAIPFEINPEGYALIPTIGSFHVANRTLADIRREIVATAKRDKYPGVAVTLDLIGMRFFTVYLTGGVISEGAHVVHPTVRVSELIEFGGGFSDDRRGTIEETVAGKKITRATQVKSQPTARRAISITHADGTRDQVDLMMFKATGNLNHNPYVHMGDRIHVSYRTEVVHIYGAVNKEGTFEFKRGDTVGDLVILAAGQSGSAPIDQAVLWRFEGDGKTTRVISLLESQGSESEKHFSLDDVADIPLEPDDMIFFRARAEWNMSPTVAIHGEIHYPGRYRIYRGETRLLDLVEAAQGLTDRASLKEAKVIRVKLRGLIDPELQRLRALFRVSGNAGLNPEERAYLKTKARQAPGRVALDFEKLFMQGDESQNILLEGGDVVFIPEKRKTVNVSGQFGKPGLVNYEEGRPVAFYIQQAGGFSLRANTGGGRLINSRTGQREALDSKVTVEPGDEIWVPENQYRDWWRLTQETMTVVAQTLTLVVLVRAF